jgi:hypothetical protein
LACELGYELRNLVIFHRDPSINVAEMTNDWSAEQADDPLHDDRRNFYKVEK